MAVAMPAMSSAVPARFSGMIWPIVGVMLAAPGEAVRHLVQVVPGPLLHAVERAVSGASGVIVEHKHGALAVHYRLAPDLRGPLEVKLYQLLASWPLYELRHGRMVLEVVPHGYNKATAVEALMQAPPFQGRVPVAIGDDLGDVSALACARRHGGLGLTVAGEHFDAAGADFAGPVAVRAWLHQLLATLTGKSVYNR